MGDDAMEGELDGEDDDEATVETDDGAGDDEDQAVTETEKVCATWIFRSHKCANICLYLV